jgi:hypothetical protein
MIRLGSSEFRLTCLFFMASFSLTFTSHLCASEKTTVGEVEDVILAPWRVRMPARIDTGAATSCLDARDIKVKGNMVEFRLPRRYGGLELRLPIVEWQKVRGADFKEKRPVVEVSLCVGNKLIRANVALNDRSNVQYPLILGRNVLRDHFVVDCTQSHCLPPSCDEVSFP